MFRKSILYTLVGAATIVSSAAAARPGGGGGGHGMAGMGMMHAGAPGLTMRTVSPHGLSHHAFVAPAARSKSQGPLHASATGIAHSSSRSVLKGTTVVGGNLSGLSRGMTVVDANGNTVGTVKRINTASGGRVVNVLVKSSTSARTIPLSPGALSVSGGVATTTSLRRHAK